MNNLITTEWLNKHLNDENIVIVDCRFNLMNPEQGSLDYNEDHIPGAFFFDLDKDLSSEILTHGGRHPLPDIKEFTEKLGNVGIDETKHVVAYDDQNGPFSARLWWLLKYLGHKNVSVLNGNYTDWKEAGYETSTEIKEPKKTRFTANIQKDMVMEMEDVKEIADQDSYKLIDARAPERFSGEVEPMDLKAGHIPNALNYFWEETKTKEGEMKSTEKLEKYFSEIKDDSIVVYCGSGVTASVTLLALDNLGIDAKLYPGGWSDWSSYEDNEVVTGK